MRQVKHDRGDFALFIQHTVFFSLTPPDSVTTHHRVTAFTSMNPDFCSCLHCHRLALTSMTGYTGERDTQFISWFKASCFASTVPASADRPIKPIIFQMSSQVMSHCSNMNEESHLIISPMCSSESDIQSLTRTKKLMCIINRQKKRLQLIMFSLSFL